MTEEEAMFTTVGQEIENSVQSQMFGKPCFKINTKAFACFFKDAMVFKLTGETHGEALSLDGSELFDPSGKGRPMKEWVQVHFDYRDHWKSFALAAAEYVGANS